MQTKHIWMIVLALALVLLLCGCGEHEATEPNQADTASTQATEETENPYYTHPGDPNNGDGTFTIGVDDVKVNIATPEGMESCGCNSESVSFMGEDGRCIQFTVVKVPDDPEMTGAAFWGRLDETCARCEENGINYQRQTEAIAVGDLDFTCEILSVLPEDKPAKTVFLAWSPVRLNWSEACTYYLELRTFDAPSLDKSPEAVTMDEVRPWLDAVILAQ